MKKLSYFLLACFFVLSTACNSDDDESDLNIVKGTWELFWEGESEEQDLNTVETFIFKADGTYENKVFKRDAESGELTCYFRVETGTYSRSGNQLTLNSSSHLYHPSDCAAMEELIEYETEEPIRTKEITFEISDQGSEITFDYGPCNDMCPPNAFCICIGPQTFTKVD